MDVTVGITVSIVEVGATADGMLVGIGVALGSMTGNCIGVAVQAVRMSKEALMIFFIENNYMLFLLHVVASRSRSQKSTGTVVSGGVPLTADEAGGAISS